MCLSAQRDIATRPEPIKAYKVFHRGSRQQLYNLYFSNLDQPFPKRTWVKERDYRLPGTWRDQYLQDGQYKSYPLGFHVLLRRRDACMYAAGWRRSLLPRERKTIVIYRVRVRK